MFSHGLGRMVNPLEDALLSELALEAAAMFEEQVTKGKVLLNVDVDMPVAHIDRPRMMEVFQNLIGNALKNMGSQKKPHIEIGAEEKGDEIICFVRDNGIGIEPQFHEKIFNLFDKLDPKSKGTGVGLVLCHRIIEAHGGRIWVESEGKGSTFRFTLKRGQ
jgi:signal transduction histidine kinase